MQLNSTRAGGGAEAQGGRARSQATYLYFSTYLPVSVPACVCGCVSVCACVGVCGTSTLI